MDTETNIRFGVSPQQADWYFCAVIDLHGETDYVDGYTAGDKPTQEDLQHNHRCRHSWVAGMMYLSDDDAEAIAATRKVECEKCERIYADRDRERYTILEWTCEATPHGAHGQVSL